MTAKERQLSELAARLFAQYGLTDWRFEFDRAKRTLGRCHHRDRVISISRHFLAANPVEVLENTLRHEIAHALTPGAKHGPAWRAKCLEVGARPERLNCEARGVPPAWVGTCPNCGHVTHKHRRSQTACRKCCTRLNHGRYDARYAFTWQRASSTPGCAR